MDQVFWKSKRFKQLERYWNRILEETGFNDIEIDLSTGRALKQRASNCYRQASPIERESRLEYYLFLGQMAHNTAFPNELERYIMVRHSEGALIKEIVEEIGRLGISRDRKTIRYIIRRWQTAWGIRTWSLTQMNLKYR